MLLRANLLRAGASISDPQPDPGMSRRRTNEVLG